MNVVDRTRLAYRSAWGQRNRGREQPTMNRITTAYRELEAIGQTASSPVPQPSTTETSAKGSVAVQSTARKVAVVLGARLGGTHVLEALNSCGVRVEGIYDASNSAPGLANARRVGVPVYSGAWSELNRMFSRVAQDAQTIVYVFLPSRDSKFVAFARRHFAHAERTFPGKLKLFEMDRDFGDYETPANLFALIRNN